MDNHSEEDIRRQATESEYETILPWVRHIHRQSAFTAKCIIVLFAVILLISFIGCLTEGTDMGLPFIISYAVFLLLIIVAASYMIMVVGKREKLIRDKRFDIRYETVTDMKMKSGQKGSSFFIFTGDSKKKYTVYSRIYNNVSIGDTVYILRLDPSFKTKAPVAKELLIPTVPFPPYKSKK